MLKEIQLLFALAGRDITDGDNNNIIINTSPTTTKKWKTITLSTSHPAFIAVAALPPEDLT
jgi:hypothetical protein